MENAVAFANNDVVVIAWSFAKKPVGCMGFAIYRIDPDGKEEVLPGFAHFKDIKPKSWSTADIPIQKFYWKDPYARLVAEKTGVRQFRYRIVALEGKPGALTPMLSPAPLVTNVVELTSAATGGVKAVFNRGLISTQRIARALEGTNKKDSLIAHIQVPDDPLRASLSGDMVEAVQEFLARASSKGKIYAALYELKDGELISMLKKLGKKLSVIIADSLEDEPVLDANGKPVKIVTKAGKTKIKTIPIDGNALARATLGQSAHEKLDRLMPSSHIAHNKFLVYVDGNGVPKAVFTGSTNWTCTGLCAQTNNAIVIDDDALAARYLAYWNELAKDTKAAAGNAKALQAPKLRAWNAEGEALVLQDKSAVHSWFSPNTPKARLTKHPNETRPADMEDLAQLIANAQHSVLFLAFFPGSPSVANWAGQALVKNKKLFVRGCVTNKSASEAFYYELKGATPPVKPKGDKTPVKQDWKVFGAEAFDSKFVPEGWQAEILNAGFAIIHDKIVVIDPFSDHCVVATGSHNLGHKASFDNDENLLLIRGNKKLAMAYATHVLDVYDHFSARYWAHHGGNTKTDLYLKKTSAAWLGKYYDDKGAIANGQLQFWLGAGV